LKQNGKEELFFVEYNTSTNKCRSKNVLGAKVVWKRAWEKLEGENPSSFSSAIL